jgi:PHD/YefM family antitoxin component YafN of YafNO toxin-antitoxin module
MTAKEKLRARVEELSEAEAADTLDYLASRRDPLAELLENAPLDDEPTTPEEEEGLREAREQVARGEVVSAEEIRREFA